MHKYTCVQAIIDSLQKTFKHTDLYTKGVWEDDWSIHFNNINKITMEMITSLQGEKIANKNIKSELEKMGSWTGHRLKW